MQHTDKINELLRKRAEINVKIAMVQKQQKESIEKRDQIAKELKDKYGVDITPENHEQLLHKYTDAVDVAFKQLEEDISNAEAILRGIDA